MKIAAGNTADAGKPPAGEPSDEATGPDAKPAITMEMVNEALAKAQSDTMAKLGRELKALREAVGGVKPATATSTGDSTATTETPTERTLRERLAEVEGRNKRQQLGAVRLSLREALVKAGADTQLAELAVPSILEGEGEQFKAAENRFGTYDVGYGDGVSLGEWAKNFMASDIGKRITSPTSAAALGLPNSTTRKAGHGKREIRRSELSRLTVADEKDLTSGHAILVEE